MLRDRGFDVYLAIDVQTILDINGGIIRELRNSDCYLLVNFRREPVGPKRFRGSLFSNQELAIAYALGFEKMLIVNQEGVKPEGMLGYIGINTEEFRDHLDCLNAVRRALDRAEWRSDYSRRLRAANLRFSDQVLTFSTLSGWFLYLDVHNDRPDIAALEATARLSGYSQHGKSFQPSTIRSPLKATGRPGFYHTIFPKSHEAFDLLVIGVDSQAHAEAMNSAGTVNPVFLNSALDVSWTCPVPVCGGLWIFRYEFFAVEFPVLTVEIEVDVPTTCRADRAPSAQMLTQELS